MAVAFNVMGPVVIETDVALAGTFVPLGTTVSDSLAAFILDHRNVEKTSSRGGDEILEVIHAGTLAALSILLEEWDASEMDTLQEKVPGVSTAGEGGTIGETWVGGSTTFSVRIQPTSRDGVTDATETVNKPQYTFGSCYLGSGDSVQFLDLGVESTKAALNILVLRNSVDAFYTKVTS